MRGVLAGTNKREAAQFKGGGRKGGGGGGGAGLFGSSNRTKARARYNNLDASKLSELGIGRGVGVKKKASSRPIVDALNASNLSQGALRAKDLARKAVMQAQAGINKNDNNGIKSKYLRSRSAYPAGGKVDPLVSSHRAAGLVAASARRGSGGSKSAPSLLSGLERIAPRDFAKKAAAEARPRYGRAAEGVGSGGGGGSGGSGGGGTRKVDSSLSPRKPPCPSPRSSNKTRNVSSSQSPLKKTVAPSATMVAPVAAPAPAIRKNSIPFGRSAKSSSNNNISKAGSDSVFDAMLKEEMASNAKIAKGMPTKEAAEILLVMESIQAKEAARAKENRLLVEKKAGKAAVAAVEQSGASQLAALARRLGNRFDHAKTLAEQYKADGLE